MSFSRNTNSLIKYQQPFDNLLPLPEHFNLKPSVLHVGRDLAPLLCLLDLNRSQMARPRVPVATGWPAFGESCHGVCKPGGPSPGDLDSWGEKTGEKT